MGSSPLARGLRPQPGEEVAEDGIIPARAGFTAHAGHQPGPAADHPRSRGVYCSRSSSGIRPAGSSPLARGLPVVEKLADWFTGSSPLARGLRPQPGEEVAEDGIIPARAGFTNATQASLDPPADHPRSRGVYGTPTSSSGPAKGSSPLARGLRRACEEEAAHMRIIPARAGFTWNDDGTPVGGSDHPRSRGVYQSPAPTGPRRSGSSPLARGLPRGGAACLRARGIIPARAGFTRSRASPPPRGEDHPRSRGVYALKKLVAEV